MRTGPNGACRDHNVVALQIRIRIERRQVKRQRCGRKFGRVAGLQIVGHSQRRDAP